MIDMNGDGKKDWQDHILLQNQIESSDKKQPANNEYHEYEGKGFEILAYIVAMLLLAVFKDRWIAWIALSLIFWPWYLKK